VLQPELQALVARFGDASSVATLEGHDVLYLAHCSEQRSRRATAMVGARYPAHATSLGRVLLAGLPEPALERYLREVEPAALTPRTVTDRAALRALIEDARRLHYATTVDQLDYGITALAVPIRNAAGRTIAALNSSGYSGMLTAEELVRNRLDVLHAAAARLADTLVRYPVLASIIGTR